MYSFRWPFKHVQKRLRDLCIKRYYHEAFVSSLLTIEQLLCNTLKHLMINQGITINKANNLLKEMNGLNGIFINWQKYDNDKRSIYTVIGKTQAEYIDKMRIIRNGIIHGGKSPSENTCKIESVKLINLLDHSSVRLI